ncbi:MAG TPA: hypothetical protein VFL56_05130 [Solirubrobacterales bacterium]|nr:hypothetical protein [Solirubrobacterales bacterium]
MNLIVIVEMPSSRTLSARDHMGKGLLAQWRRGIVTRGFAGAILSAVPVAIAAAIGFGTSLSGVAGGLSSIASGPDAITTSTGTTPTKLNRAVATLASRDAADRSTVDGGSDGSSGGGSGIGEGTTGGGTTGGGTTGGGSAGGGDGIPTIDPPDIGLPGGDGGTSGGGSLDDTVNGVVDGVGNTVNGLLGQ